MLIFGPPGLGKTTLANIIAAELGVNLRQTSGPVLERPADLAALLTNLQPRDVLFVDEIHRLSPVVEEVLYPAMEDYQLDIMIGEGPAARSIKLNLPPFTLVGATTRAGICMRLKARPTCFSARSYSAIGCLGGAVLVALGDQPSSGATRTLPPFSRRARALLATVRHFLPWSSGRMAAGLWLAGGGSSSRLRLRRQASAGSGEPAATSTKAARSGCRRRSAPLSRRRRGRCASERPRRERVPDG